ncbi:MULTISPECIES: sulfite exporter TauE/SafE family protein [unclassified Prochlorococcus]|uniref:sulfite exporter TauE/SafE family protein n=1 Tax=unclassified Prochlorococcus TaxID=2627481 RepID=UPI0005339F6D|nr:MULTISPECIES: sulfite exporter TauE/SafE family protein [unclassified Prochlorococcus]KGG15030.1 putative permease [Prochlorococcus sp. MIT 0602]KGG17301.1 putative permease [Prochlorococcus sp. MIT 0603]
MITQFLLALIAIASNFFSALSGGGAGLVQLPALIFLGLPFTTALATHKIASVALGIGATIRHNNERSIATKLYLIILLSGLPGVFIGANIVIAMPEHLASILLGFLTLIIGIYSYNLKITDPNQSKYSLGIEKIIIGSIVLFIIGLLNGSMSSGTGLFVTLWLVKWFRISYTNAVAYTLAIVGIVWNGTGAVVLAFNNEVMWSWIPALIFGSLTGGFLGANFAISKGELFVKKSFEFLSIAIGISLISKGFLLFL